MRNRFRQVREEHGLTTAELAGMLGVHQSTLSNWEAGRRQITADMLLQMAEAMRVSTDYLLGRSDAPLSRNGIVDRKALCILHGQPIWTESHGWMLVNTIKNAFVRCDLSLIPFDEIRDELYLVPPLLSVGLRGLGAPLALPSVLERERIWLEPISTDTELAGELRGWYHITDRRFAQNEFGNRFYLNTYGVKWLAFDHC